MSHQGSHPRCWRSATAAGFVIAASALIGLPAVACEGAHDRPAPQADLRALHRVAGDDAGPSGPTDGSCATVERIARRYLADPGDDSRRQVALRREVQRALAACRGSRDGAPPD